MAKKDKKKKDEEPVVQEVQVAVADLEEEKEEVQYTETSYTSASLESLPPLPVEEVKKKKKSIKKKAEEETTKRGSSQMFQWSEESLPIEEEKPVVEAPVEKKKKEKGKKKGKKEKEEIPDFDKVHFADDKHCDSTDSTTSSEGVMAEEKMRPETHSHVPKNWKKMNKKERDAWLVQRIEEWRVELEAEKQAKLAGAKEKKAALARERAELMVKDNAEQEIRRDILQKTCTLFARYDRQNMEYENKKQIKAEWSQYLRCDGLPDPRIVTQMSTYLHLWKERAVYDDSELDQKCEEALPMLEMLEEFVANSRQYTPQQAANYNEVRLALRQQLAVAIEFASYSLLRDLEKHLKWHSIKLATYNRMFMALKLNLWVAVRMPTRRPKPQEPELEPVELEFPAIKVSVRLPTNIDGTDVCVRASLTLIDLISESSRSFALAADMPNRFEDLFIFNVKEHVETYKLKKEQDVLRNNFYKSQRDRIKELENYIKTNVQQLAVAIEFASYSLLRDLEKHLKWHSIKLATYNRMFMALKLNLWVAVRMPTRRPKPQEPELYAKIDKEKEELDELNLAEPPFMPDPRTFIGECNEKAFKKYLKTCNVRTRSGEINLRKYRICGGVLNLDLLLTPPQPKHMKYEVTVVTLELPKQLKPMDYKVQYRAPGPAPPGVTRTPEEIEAEMKKTEAEYEKLALVNIDLSQEVLWNEPPVLCQWQEPRKLWTSNYVNDYKYNEDKLNVQFRTGVLWPIGIATLRYSNMPYQGWDMRPDPKGKGVILTVTGVSVTVTWQCVGSSVKLKWIANATTPALKTQFNKKFSVKRMAQIMREASCDFFPDFDAHNHVEGSCPKEWVMERHNYHAMAFLARSYNFQWSKWNANAGSRNIIMQIREAVDKKREEKLQLLCVTPQRTNILKCDELATEFDMKPMVGMGFYPDLFTLNLSYGSVDARRNTFDMKFKTVETIFNMLQELKLSSYS